MFGSNTTNYHYRPPIPINYGFFEKDGSVYRFLIWVTNIHWLWVLFLGYNSNSKNNSCGHLKLLLPNINRLHVTHRSDQQFYNLISKTYHLPTVGLGELTRSRWSPRDRKWDPVKTGLLGHWYPPFQTNCSSLPVTVYGGLTVYKTCNVNDSSPYHPSFESEWLLTEIWSLILSPKIL